MRSELKLDALTPRMMSKREKREYVQIAKDLHYGKTVVDAINKCVTEAEVQRVLVDARHNMWG